MTYDSRPDTLLHIATVNSELNNFADELIVRGACHDSSKLYSPEVELFDEMTPMLKNLVYGSPAYAAFLERLKPALKHHYHYNSHHPEFYVNGIDGMNLYDLVEMYCDWKAATKRNKDGDIVKSVAYNRVRFEMSDQLYNIFINTLEKEGLLGKDYPRV